MFKAELLAKKAVSPNVIEFTYSRPLNFNYLPGQYISIVVDKITNRSYSLNSPPLNSETISSLVDISPGGKGTTYLKKMAVGGLITFKGPYGHMILPDKLDTYKNLNFIATGTGICPFISIISHLEGADFTGKINLLYSEKYQNDLLGLSNLKIDNIAISLTREEVKGYNYGRVTAYLKKLPREKALFFICGNTRMLLEVIKLLKRDGVKDSKVIYESFYY
ncbi:hypothetical protein GW755_02680 [bacterium]|nr:hypothetical protein [bacterium]